MPGAPAAGPGPLEIIAAEPARDINRFADRIEAGNRLCFHGLGGKLICINAAGCDFRLGKAFGSLGRHCPIFKQRCKLFKIGGSHGLRQPLRQQFGQNGLELGLGPRMPSLLEKLERINAGCKIKADRLALAPVGRDLQDGRTGKTAVGEENAFPE